MHKAHPCPPPCETTTWKISLLQVPKEWNLVRLTLKLPDRPWLKVFVRNLLPLIFIQGWKRASSALGRKSGSLFNNSSTKLLASCMRGETMEQADGRE